jgi:hypothetical protein
MDPTKEAGSARAARSADIAAVNAALTWLPCPESEAASEATVAWDPDAELAQLSPTAAAATATPAPMTVVLVLGVFRVVMSNAPLEGLYDLP